MRELLPDERMSPYIAQLSGMLENDGWHCTVSEARYAWPRTELYADHASGARMLAWASWKSCKPVNGLGLKSWPMRKHRFWASPPPGSWSFLRRSPWVSLPGWDSALDYVGARRLPPGLQAYGWPPGYGSACRCGKVVLHSEQEAADALAKAKLARAAGMTRRRECRYYQCPDDALSFHLTSRALPVVPEQRRADGQEKEKER